jgi:hypothetical protein
MQGNEKTLIVITGGTIESSYNPEEATPYHVPLTHAPQDSVIPAAMQMLGLTERRCDYYPLCIKDSKETWLPGHMEALIHHIADQGYTKLVIVQGTDTMPAMAQAFAHRLNDWEGRAGLDRLRVVFTGAMTPLRDKHQQWRGLDAHGTPELENKNCDGWGNLRLAYEDAQNAKPGIYIEMGQGPWPAHEVRKDVTLDRNRPSTTVQQSSFVHTPGKPQEIHSASLCR